MKNIWFLRTDKDDWGADFDTTVSNPNIFSAHGSCVIDQSILEEHENKFFPELNLSKQELKSLIYSVKSHLTKSGVLDTNEESKNRCDLTICNWIYDMEVGDIVFVRNKCSQIIICKINSYLSHAFLREHRAFQRGVKILDSLSISDKAQMEAIAPILHRTAGRKTLEKNNNQEVRSFVQKFISNKYQKCLEP